MSRTRHQPLSISLILIVEPGETQKEFDCGCKNPLTVAIPEYLRCSSDVRCPKCPQRYHVQWVEADRVRPGTESPDQASYFTFVAIEPDGSSNTVEWNGKKWMKYGKDVHVHQWFELNRRPTRSPGQPHPCRELTGI